MGLLRTLSARDASPWPQPQPAEYNCASVPLHGLETAVKHKNSLGSHDQPSATAEPVDCNCSPRTDCSRTVCSPGLHHFSDWHPPRSWCSNCSGTSKGNCRCTHQMTSSNLVSSTEKPCAERHRTCKHEARCGAQRAAV